MKCLVILIMAVLLALPNVLAYSDEIDAEDISRSFVSLLAQENFVEASKLLLKNWLKLFLRVL